MESSPEKKPEITFRDVFPGLTEEELREAEYNFRRYLEIALQVCAEQDARRETPDVDTRPVPPTMKERSNRTLKD